MIFKEHRGIYKKQKIMRTIHAKAQAKFVAEKWFLYIWLYILHYSFGKWANKLRI